MAVTLNGIDRTVMFTTTSKSPEGTQTVTFRQLTGKVERHSLCSLDFTISTLDFTFSFVRAQAFFLLMTALVLNVQ